MNMKTLGHKSAIRLTGWDSMTFATVGTLFGFCAENNEAHRYAEKLQLAKDNGHEIAWSIYAGTVLSDSAGHYDRLEEQVRKAETLEEGEIVLIEGAKYSVKVMPRCDKSPAFCDPVHFIPAA